MAPRVASPPVGGRQGRMATQELHAALSKRLQIVEGRFGGSATAALGAPGGYSPSCSNPSRTSSTSLVMGRYPGGCSHPQGPGQTQGQCQAQAQSQSQATPGHSLGPGHWSAGTPRQRLPAAVSMAPGTQTTGSRSPTPPLQRGVGLLHHVQRQTGPAPMSVAAWSSARSLPGDRVRKLSITRQLSDQGPPETGAAFEPVARGAVAEHFVAPPEVSKPPWAQQRSVADRHVHRPIPVPSNSDESFSESLAELARERSTAEMRDLREENEALQRRNHELAQRAWHADVVRKTFKNKLTDQWQAMKLQQESALQAEAEKQTALIQTHMAQLEEVTCKLCLVESRNEDLQNELADLRVERDSQLSSLSAKVRDLEAMNAELAGGGRQSQDRRVADLTAENEKLKQLATLHSELAQENQQTISELQHWRQEQERSVETEAEKQRVAEQHRAAVMEQENKKLLAELQQWRAEQERQQQRRQRVDSSSQTDMSGNTVEKPQSSQAGASGEPEKAEPRQGRAEDGLRIALTNQSTSTDELHEAISSVEALVNEAKRELAVRRLRDRRSAYEQLHEALERNAEGQLASALCAARRAGLDSQDMSKAEEKLEQLRALTHEQREKKALHERRAKAKEQAFLFVKRDDVGALVDLLEDLPEEIRWRDWRDHAGRTLIRCAQDLRSHAVQQYLAPLQTPRRNSKPLALELTVDNGSLAAPGEFRPESLAQQAGDTGTTPDTPRRESPASTPLQELTAIDEDVPDEDLTEDELAELRKQAFRSVVQDDAASLQEVFRRVPQDIWSSWYNKAGRDLLTLCEERGSSEAYSVVAKALDLVVEREREIFEEREAVWVLFPGELQPRRASVLEDTPKKNQEVLLEFWDGEEPPTLIDRCMVAKST